MNDSVSKIPFHVEINRVIEVLARQIYQSPLALLRENTQNAFDAILLRQQKGQQFDPAIHISITPDEVIIEDNGIGMTWDDLENHFWRAGSSGKDNPEAKAAGVVGTFGIGAMANFGIATELLIETESALTGARTRSFAQRDSLSANQDCIDMIPLESTRKPGTRVAAKIQPEAAINVEEAARYLQEFVRFTKFPILANGELLSQKSLSEAVKKPATGRTNKALNSRLTSDLTADVELVISGNGEVWIHLNNMKYLETSVAGTLILRQRLHQIQSLRSGFGLATVTVSSDYNYGGVADLTGLQPTAGREALSTESMQFLQAIITQVDNYVSEQLASWPESDMNTDFMRWVQRNGRFELCNHLQIRLEPDNIKLSLEDVKQRTATSPMNYYRGSDSSIINSYASDENPLIILASSSPRRECEAQYLQRFCNVSEVSDAPTVLSRRSASDFTLAESALVFRIVSILQRDYFLPANVTYGEISHNLPLWFDTTAKPVDIVLNSGSDSVEVMLRLHDSDFQIFESMVKDYVRNIVFPKVENLVPSSTRQGAEAFLKIIRRPREYFELDVSDLGSLSEIWNDYVDGKLPLVEAARRSSIVARRNVQVVDRHQAQSIDRVIPDVIENQRMLETEQERNDLLDPENLDALPAITRLETPCSAKLLTIESNEFPLKGFRAFLAITDRVYQDKGEFFLQPHRTSVVWGGQRVLFVFQHHSGQFGLYYDLQTSEVVAPTSGGRPFPTCTLALKDHIYIPIPEEIKASFIPTEDEKKRFEIRCDLLYTESRQPRLEGDHNT